MELVYLACLNERALTFSEFPFDNLLLDSLNAMGFKNPTPIQELAIPVILDNTDVVACAQTGTGKTAAYILPVINKMLSQKHLHLNTLVIAPTRELAQQIDQQIEGFAYYTGITSIPVYGGTDGATWDQQKRALEKGADIVIATPGRLMAILAGGTVDFSSLEHLILDEADRMLEMGFYEDIVRIISYLPAKRQTLLFSATMPSRIRQLANRILTKPKEINIAIAKPAEGIDQQVYLVYDKQKHALLKHILNQENWSSILVFASRKETVKKLERSFEKWGITARGFHSDLDQTERELILRGFKNKQVKIIVGTDVLSRGIDVKGIGLVVNWDAPPDAEDYVHRIGRTARADNTGTAITFINEYDQTSLVDIERLIEREIPRGEMPAEVGEGPAFNPTYKKKRRPGNNRKFSKKRPYKR